MIRFFGEEMDGPKVFALVLELSKVCSLSGAEFAPEHGAEQTSLSENVCSSSVEFCAHSHSVEKSIPSYVNHHITSLQ